MGEQIGSGVIPIKKPDALTTVLKAYLFAAATTFSGYFLKPGDISINGTPTVFDPSLDITNRIGRPTMLPM